MGCPAPIKLRKSPSKVSRSVSTGCSSSVTVIMKPLGAAILVASASGLQHFKLDAWTFSEPGGRPRREPIRISRDTETAIIEMKPFPNG